MSVKLNQTMENKPIPI